MQKLPSPYRKSIQWKWFSYYVNGRIATRAMAYDGLKRGARVEVFTRQARPVELSLEQAAYYVERHARHVNRVALRAAKAGL